MTIAEAALLDLCAAVFRAAGAGAAEAGDAAAILVAAEGMGIGTHGVARVETYAQRMREGWINPAPQILEDAAAPALRRVDGDNALGPAAAMRGLRAAMAAARDCGVGAAFVRRSNHFGAVAPYALIAAEAGFASIAMSNSAPTLAPAGGTEARVGNSPLGFGFPGPGGAHVLVDVAMSMVARSHIRDAARRGAPIPEGWAVDARGAPVTDAVLAMKSLLAPIGGHKGYALALAVDMLAGVLSGAGFLTRVPDVNGGAEGVSDLGHAFVLIDVVRLMPEAMRDDRMTEAAALLRATPAADPARQVRTPGERALKSLARARAEGFDVSADLLARLRTLAG